MFGTNPADYDFKKELAPCCNGLGTVYLVQHRQTGEHLTIKKYRMDRAKEESKQIVVRIQMAT